MLLLAASSSVETYGGQGGSVATRVHESGSSLPFTGLDALTLIAVAIVLVFAGMLLARLAHGADES